MVNYDGVDTPTTENSTVRVKLQEEAGGSGSFYQATDDDISIDVQYVGVEGTSGLVSAPTLEKFILDPTEFYFVATKLQVTLWIVIPLCFYCTRTYDGAHPDEKYTSGARPYFEHNETQIDTIPIPIIQGSVFTMKVMNLPTLLSYAFSLYMDWLYIMVQVSLNKCIISFKMLENTNSETTTVLKILMSEIVCYLSRLQYIRRKTSSTVYY